MNSDQQTHEAEAFVILPDHERADPPEHYVSQMRTWIETGRSPDVVVTPWPGLTDADREALQHIADDPQTSNRTRRACQAVLLGTPSTT